jgi:uncharacterized protein (TIGR00730 family)
MKRIVTVFGSARVSKESEEYAQAYAVGRALARAGFTVCNGGYGGAMEASAKGAKDAGGETIGVSFNTPGRIQNSWIDTIVETGPLSERLLKLVELGDAYVVLKGGTGTLLELACVWEFVNKGIVPKKPIIILGSFWQPVVETLRGELLWEGHGDCTEFIQNAGTAEECAQLLVKAMAQSLVMPAGLS